LADSVGAGLALTDIGNICNQEIKHMISLRPDLEMWEYVIMPNHIHLLLSFGSITSQEQIITRDQSVEASHDPTQAYHNQKLSSII
jgi:REP element-mobilizing transposase RayT